MTDYIDRLRKKKAISPREVPTKTTETVSVGSVGTQDGNIPDFAPALESRDMSLPTAYENHENPAPRPQKNGNTSIQGAYENDENPQPSWPPRPLELARWPLEWRAKWGVRANELQDQGVGWPEHERRAFVEVKAEREG